MNLFHMFSNFAVTVFRRKHTGGLKGIRTPDLLLARETFYH